MVSYHLVQYQKKTKDPILIKFSNGWRDGETDKGDFIGRCPTNVERPIKELTKKVDSAKI